MSYAFWPSGIPGTGLEDGPYSYTQNIHISGDTFVNSASIQDGIGREIAVLQNYLSTTKFMSGIPIGTGYFYSVGTEENPIEYLYINDGHIFQTIFPEGLSDYTATSDVTAISLTSNNIYLGDDVTACPIYISGYLKNDLENFILNDNKTLYVSGYWDTDNNYIYDMIRIKDGKFVISETPTGYLNSYPLNDDIYAIKIIINSGITGHINYINMSGGMIGQHTKDTANLTNPSITFDPGSGWNPFQYQVRYLNEYNILFNDSSGHSYGEGDLGLLNYKNIVLSGSTFNDLTWSGHLQTTVEWFNAGTSEANQKYLMGQQYKDALYIAVEDWGSGCTNIMKYHKASGFMYSTGIYINDLQGMTNFKDNLFLTFGNNSSGVLFKYDNISWHNAGEIIGSGLYKPYTDGLYLYCTSYNTSASGNLAVYRYGSSLSKYAEIDHYNTGIYGSITSDYKNIYVSTIDNKGSGNIYYIPKDSNNPTGILLYGNAFSGLYDNFKHMENFSYNLMMMSGAYYITRGDRPTPYTEGNLGIIHGTIDGVHGCTYNDSVYWPIKSGEYDYVRIFDNNFMFYRLNDNQIYSMFPYGEFLYAAVSGELYRTNDDFRNILKQYIISK